MAIPSYEEFMKPLLRLAEDGAEHTAREAYNSLAEHFRLSPDEREHLLPSGRQRTFENRIGWARTYLAKAGLLESPSRGMFRLTPRGREVLQENPSEITSSYLRRFAEFVEFKSLAQQPADATSDSLATPEEALENSYVSLRAALGDELLQRVKACSPQFFEKLVVDLLVAMGYGGSRRDAGSAVGRSGDGGIDGIIKEDPLGLDVVYIQAKRWEAGVGRPVVQAFAGSLEGHRARKGVLITTSHFTQDAKDYVDRIEKRIVLVGGQELAELMIDHQVGVTDVATYPVKRVDLDYFPDESTARELEEMS